MKVPNGTTGKGIETMKQSEALGSPAAANATKQDVRGPVATQMTTTATPTTSAERSNPETSVQNSTEDNRGTAATSVASMVAVMLKRA
jgi:hypothetical protein